MEKPYLNVVTNDTLADVYTRNANSLGVKFQSNMEKIKDVSFNFFLEEFSVGKKICFCKKRLLLVQKREVNFRLIIHS